MAMAAGDVGGLQIIATTLAIVVALGFSFFLASSRSLAILEQWAAVNGYRLVRHQFRWLSRGPFTFTTTKGQTVYRITVETPDGWIRHGWARCGHWIFGLFSSTVRVEWDEQSTDFPVIAPDRPSDSGRRILSLSSVRRFQPLDAAYPIGYYPRPFATRGFAFDGEPLESGVIGVVMAR